MVQLSCADAQKTLKQADLKEQGFALTSFVALVPLCMTLFVAVGACFFLFKRKSLAQSLCVQQAVRLQEDLGAVLDKLLRLNPRAKTLRRERSAAERAFQLSLQSGNPAAIASARAALLAVKLAQAALRSQQGRLLDQAEFARGKRPRELRGRLARLSVSGFRSRQYFHRALAVEPVPPGSDSPDYIPAQPFARLQQHRFDFRVDLTPPFLPGQWRIRDLVQPAACAATLQSEASKWRVQILAASASSN
jgi:hypothetical protein